MSSAPEHQGSLLAAISKAMVAMGDEQRVREGRVAFQVATREEFVTAIEQIVQRKVRAFASATDVEEEVVFENFVFEAEQGGDGARPPA